MENIPFFTGLFTSRVVQDFFQQYNVVKDMCFFNLAAVACLKKLVWFVFSHGSLLEVHATFDIYVNCVWFTFMEPSVEKSIHKLGVKTSGDPPEVSQVGRSYSVH